MTDTATADMAREADATRERIAATFDELQDRLTPQSLLSSAAHSVTSQVRGQGLAAFDAGRRLLGGHPAVLALAGVAAGLALFGRSKIKNATVNAGDYEPYSDYDDGYSAMAIDEPDHEPAPRAGPSPLERIEEHPIAIVLAGLALGALAGALLPPTETERNLLTPR